MKDYELKALKRGAVLSLPFVVIWLAAAALAYRYPQHLLLALASAGGSMMVLPGYAFARRIDGIQARDSWGFYFLVLLFGAMFVWGFVDYVRKGDVEGAVLMVVVCGPFFISSLVGILLKRKSKRPHSGS